VIFNIKTNDECTGKIEMKNDKKTNDISSNIDKKPIRKLEIQTGRIEVKEENGSRFNRCFDPDTFKNIPKFWTFLQKDKNGNELIIVEVRERIMKKGKEDDGKTYRFFPISKNLKEAELIRDLIDMYFIKKR